MVALHLDAVDECVDGLVRLVGLIHLMALRRAVREGDGSLSVSDSDAGQRPDADERTRVVGVVIVRTLHQCTLRVDVPQAHIHTHWGIEVRQYRFARCCIVECLHIFFLFGTAVSLYIKPC